MISIDEMASFCKRRGFVYPSSEIYGGLAGFWDYGHIGVELKNNIKKEWWKFHVQRREDIVGIDGSIITHPKVWKASGHLDSFSDVMVECSKCHERYRADQLIEEVLKISADDLKREDIDKLVEQNKIKCLKCKGGLGKAEDFNMMFKTFVGPAKDESSIAYLRPETAQVQFADFKLIVENARLKLPFGIAQIGRAFRNEISPRNFLFRCREFEQMEIEYFVHPKKMDECPFIKEVLELTINVYSAEIQEKKKKPVRMKIKDALKKNIIKTKWHAYWLATEHKWFINLGATADKFRIRQHLEKEKSHYALDTWDLEYEFPFGWKELQGLANRTDFDLKQHMKLSNKDLSLFDEESKEKVVPYVVAEPSQGVDRAFLVFMFDAYTYDKKRENIVLKLHPKLAPVKVGVFPLLSNKKELVNKAKEIYYQLIKEWTCTFDLSGSIGRRYSRQDEIGTPLCITIDFQSLEDSTLTIRDRDTTQQIRVKISELENVITRFFNGEKLHKLGKIEG